MAARISLMKKMNMDATTPIPELRRCCPSCDWKLIKKNASPTIVPITPINLNAL
jgi:hypothetical protein